MFSKLKKWLTEKCHKGDNSAPLDEVYVLLDESQETNAALNDAIRRVYIELVATNNILGAIVMREGGSLHIPSDFINAYRESSDSLYFSNDENGIIVKTVTNEQ